MFDVGFAELVLLLIIGLLVLGPEKLPRLARTLGGLTRKARSSWLNLKRSIEAEIQAEELKKPMRQLRENVEGKLNEARSGAQSIRQELSGRRPGETPPDQAPKNDEQ